MGQEKTRREQRCDLVLGGEVKIICGWCQRTLGWKIGAGTSHGICSDCEKKFFGTEA